MTRRVDVHAHYFPEPYVEAMTAREEPPKLVWQDGALILDFGPGGTFPLHPEMTDLEMQVAAMDDAGVDQAILSIIPPAVDGLEAADARVLAAASNDVLSEVSKGNHGRFRAVAMLPAVDPDAAAAELQRAVGLGLRGGVLLTNVRGARLDDERFRPIFEAAADLDVPIVLHPTTPAIPDPFLGFALMTIAGFIMETTVCALRLVFTGLYERHPDFKLLVPHVGASIPYLLGRIEYEAERYGVVADTLSEPLDDHLRRLYLDSVCAWPPALKLALDAFGTDRVLLGTDVPFWAREKNVDALDDVGLDAADLEKVSAGNADAFFGTTGTAA